MSAPKILAQIILSTAQIVGRACVEAYKEAAINAASQQARHSAAHASKDTISKAVGITLDEAYSILNVPKTAKPDQIQERYSHLFKQNDPTKGGSFYLQSKVFRAKERIDMSFSSPSSSSSSSSSTQASSSSSSY